MFTPRAGILERLGPGALKPEIMRRIERLGRLSDAVLEARGAGDRQKLADLAEEYEAMRCPGMAEALRREATLL